MFFVLVLLNPPIVRDYYTEEIIGNASLHPNASTRTINVRKKTKIVKKKYYFSNVSIMKQIMNLLFSIFMIYYFNNYCLKLNTCFNLNILILHEH